MVSPLLKGIFKITVIPFQRCIDPAEPEGMPWIEIITVNDAACGGWCIKMLTVIDIPHIIGRTADQANI